MTNGVCGLPGWRGRCGPRGLGKPELWAAEVLPWWPPWSLSDLALPCRVWVSPGDPEGASQPGGRSRSR